MNLIINKKVQSEGDTVILENGERGSVICGNCDGENNLLLKKDEDYVFYNKKNIVYEIDKQLSGKEEPSELINKYFRKGDMIQVWFSPTASEEFEFIRSTGDEVYYHEKATTNKDPRPEEVFFVGESMVNKIKFIK